MTTITAALTATPALTGVFDLLTPNIVFPFLIVLFAVTSIIVGKISRRGSGGRHHLGRIGGGGSRSPCGRFLRR